MNKPDFSPTLLSMREMNLHQKLRYLTFLQKEGEETVYVAAIMCLISSFQQVLPNELEDLKVKKSLIQHFTNFSGKLLVNRKYAKALSVLEFALKQLPKNPSKDTIFQNLTTLIHNNLAVYSVNINEYDLAAKSLHICLKKDSGLDLNLSCIFHNNLAGIYHASGNYEKAYKCAKKCIFLLQPLVFDQIKSTATEILKKDPRFKKSLVILLIGYLNIAASIRGHRSQGLAERPVLREMLDVDPKTYYWNSLKLATKFLGKDHFLYQRIAVSFQKFEESEEAEPESPEINSKKMFNSDQSSEIERNQSMSKYSTKYYKKSDEMSSPLTERVGSKDRVFEDLGGYQVQKSFRIRETSLPKQPRKKQSVDITPSKTSLDATLGGLNNTPRENRLSSEFNSQNHMYKNHRRYKSTTSEFNAIMKKEGLNSMWPNFTPKGNMPPFTPNQPYLYAVLQQQKEIQAQFEQKYAIHKQSFPSIDGDNNHDRMVSLKAQEDALKIEKLQQEIDGLKQTFREFEAKNLVREDSKAFSDTKQPSLSSLGPQIYQANTQDGLIHLVKSSSVVSASSKDEPYKTPTPLTKKLSSENVNKRDSFMMVLPIPTSIEALDSQMFDVSTINSNPNRLKYAIFKKRVNLEDNSEYLLVCKAIWTKEKKLFNLELVKNAEEDSQIIHKKQLNYKELQAVLKQIKYQDSLPVSFQIKEIRNFFPLIKFLLMPFVSIKTDKEGKQQIMITSQPSNILPSPEKALPTINFMKKECTLLFLHIINNMFRLILTDVCSAEDSLRIDVEFDADSIHHYFQKKEGYQSDLRSASASLKIIQAFDDYSDENELLAAKKIVERISHPDRTEEEELDSYKLTNTAFSDDLFAYIQELEKFFLSKGLSTLKEMLDEKQIKYCKISITSQAKKPCLHVVWDKPDQNFFEVSLANLFDTFAPNGKAKVQGTFKYTYKAACKQFGLICEKMELCDKISLCSLIADLFMLEVFEKKLSPEEAERYDKNPITFAQIETGTYYRTYLGTGTKYPLTFSLMGIKGVPRGVKVTLYNREELEEHGAFFHINYNCWVKDLNERKKRRTYSVDPFEIIDYYHLESIFKAGGWKILQEALVIDTNLKKMQIIGIKIMKGISIMEQLENILNPESLLKLLKAKEEANDE